MAIVYLGIGSNLGNREENCLKAIKLLEERGISVRKVSSLYETEPWGVNDQPNFVNMASECETDLHPEELLRVIKDIEVEIGRRETFKWGPRVIDIDILLYDDLVYDSPHLKIPHPLMSKRDFVLRPLSEIGPNKIHPLLKKTIRELQQTLQRTSVSSGRETGTSRDETG